MSLKDQLLPVVDQMRGLITALGFRNTTITLRTKTWASGVVGQGAVPNPVDVVLTPTPKLVYRGNGEFLVTNITPPYTGGGYAVSALLPSQPKGVETYIVLTWTDGWQRECKIVDIERKALRYSLIVKDRR